MAAKRLSKAMGLRALTGGACAAALAIGCASEAQYTADEEEGSTHALVSVERSRTASDRDDVRAAALAGFVRIPVTVDTTTALDLMGLELQLPELGRCANWETQRDPDTPLTPIDRVELLPAGDVSLSVANSETVLAPRAFPTVTDLISGVVYTTRDLSAEPLPAGVSYVVRAAGSNDVESLEVTTDAPREPAGVAIGGVPLGEVLALSGSAPIHLTWAAGELGDIVYAKLSADGGACTVCAYDDVDGAAAIPAGVFAGLGAGRISVHRVRSVVFEAPDIESGELRFDFELATDVTYVE